MTSAAKYRLHESIGYLLSLTSRAQERRLDERLKTLGLTRITWCVLLAVGNEALCNPSQIAAFVGIDRTATSRALRQMEAEGMIARRAGQADGRTRAVQLTQMGCDLLGAGTPFAQANAARIVGALSCSEVASLRQILAKIRADDETPLHRL